MSGKELEDIDWRKKNGSPVKKSNVSRRLRELAHVEPGEPLPPLEARNEKNVEYRYRTELEPPKPVYLVKHPFKYEMITTEEYAKL